MTKIFWLFFAFIGPITFIQLGYYGLGSKFLIGTDQFFTQQEFNSQWFVIRLNDYVHNNHILLSLLTLILLIKEIFTKNIKIPKITILIFLFFLVAMISSYLNNIFDIDKYGQYFFFFLPIIFVFFFFKNYGDIKIFLNCILIYLIFNGMVGFYDTLQWVYWNGLNYGWQEFCYLNINCPHISENTFVFRVSGLAFSQISYVTLLVIGLLISDMKLTKYSNLLKYFFLIMLFLCFSRTAYVMLLIYFITSILYSLNIKKLVRFKKVIPYLILCLFLLPFSSLIFDRVFDIFNINFNIIRISIFKNVINESLINSSNLFFGHGFGSYKFEYNNQIFLNTHNIFLDVLYSTGMIGLVIFLYVAIYLLSNTFFYNNNHHSKEQEIIFQKLLILQLIIWTSCLVENTILGIEVGWIIGFLFAIPLFFKNEEKKINNYK